MSVGTCTGATEWNWIVWNIILPYGAAVASGAFADKYCEFALIDWQMFMVVNGSVPWLAVIYKFITQPTNQNRAEQPVEFHGNANENQNENDN